MLSLRPCVVCFWSALEVARVRPGQLGIVDATHLPPGGPDVNILQAGRPIELFPAKMAPIISTARTEKA